ncbi:peptide/nickel transport system permease protein [Kitasatospora sp. MAP12-15]|uniref:ABC transporter permease n=1 Tax=unclassified Kitasatospora TaxID=2633591 RepID=UPI002475B9E6|nr:ABC transporter permease [Kitasatospora sp. MAP12-44]MDH6115012.1 peptide/nickel transport system permease protein [Kitasatospora sp. MAP12-44]
MTAYLIRRLFQSVVTVFMVTVISFGLMKLMPGGPVRAILGSRATPANIAHLTQQMGLDKPLYSQYWTWLDDLLHGNLGFDYAQQRPVSDLLFNALGASAYIVGSSLLLAMLIAVPMGMIQATRRNSALDHAFTVFSFVAYGVPTFFLGFLIQQWFEDDLRWVSVQNQISTFGGALTHPEAVCLPVLTLTVTTVAGYSRYMRSGVLDQITQEYVRTAQAKGASMRRTLYAHVLRNALIPMVTLIGLSLPALVGGALIVEYVFNIQGIGLLTTRAALQNDYSITLAATLLTAVVTVIGSLLADIGYAVLDPRVRLT